MAASTGDLIARFSSTGYPKVAGEIDNLTSKGKKAEGATNSLAKSLTQLAAGAVSVAALSSAVHALVDTNREFEKLRAGLVTATGGVDGMNEAWASLMKFAMDTPYGIQQVTESFTKLVNYGLTPSMEALTSYGDTASAMSKSLDQMIEAVADAATGEFERLKEFGIRAKNNGDTITFTFRGVATTVKNSSKEIEDYLINLGKTNFGGAMARQMATLDGAIANMSDTWDQFKYNLSDGVFADTAAGGINLVTNALNEMNNQMQSGATESNLDAWAVAWSGWRDSISTTIDDAIGLWNDMFEDMDTGNRDAIDTMSDYTSHFPSNLLMYLKQANAYLNGFVMDAKSYGEAIVQYLNPLNWDVDGVTKNLQQQLANNKKYVQNTVDDAEQQAVYTQTMQDIFGDAAIRKADERRKTDEQHEKTHQDTLAKFRQNGGSVSNSTDKKKGKTDAEKEAERLAKQNEAQYKQLVEDLRTQEEAIQDSYQKRVEIIKKNTEAGSDLQKDLLDRAYKEMTDAEADRRQQSLAQVEQIRMDLQTEEEALLESYERRRGIILENEELTATQREDLMKALSDRYMEQQKMLMLNQVANMAGYMQSSLSTLTSALQQYSSESNVIYKTLFAAQKAMAIPSMIVSTEEGATKALALGPVAGPIASAAIRTLGYASIATVAGQAIAGLFDQGGLIPAGKSGIVGEYGPEIVNGPAVVTSRRATMDKINGASGGTGSANQRPILNQTFMINGTGVGDKQLKSMLADAASQGAKMGYQSVLSDADSRGNISRKLGR